MEQVGFFLNHAIMCIQKDHVVVLHIYFWTVSIFMKAANIVIAFFCSVKNLIHGASSTKADLKWLEVVFTSNCCISEM